MTIYLADIRQKWDFVRPGLERMCERMDTGWRPEDVYADCKHGVAWLYLAEGDEGFMVVREHINMHSAERSMYVWVMYAYEGENAIDRYMPDLDKLARENGYTKVIMDSPRRGWQRKEGWKEQMTTYLHEVA